MKKTLIIFFAALLLVTCFASTAYKTAGDLFNEWSLNGFPDYVCGVWSNDGTMDSLTIALTDENAKNEVLSLIGDSSSVSFVYMEHSRNMLSSVQEELIPYFESDRGLVTSALNEIDNCITLGILEERKDHPDTLSMIAELREKYGDIFVIEYTEAPVLLIEENAESVSKAANESGESKKDNALIGYIIFGVMALAVILSVSLVAFKKKPEVEEEKTEEVEEVEKEEIEEVEKEEKPCED